MNNEIINALKESIHTIYLDDNGFYENEQEELIINLPGLSVTLVFRIDCSNDKIDLIEYVQCYDLNDVHYDFSNQNIEEIESIIKNRTTIEGGFDEGSDFYDPRENGETI